MADRAAKQPRQSDFDRVTFSQPPPKPANEPVMPIDLLIPKPTAPGEAAKPPEEPKATPKGERSEPKVKPSPAPAAKPAEDAEPPKEKISVMLPAAMVERLRDAAYWERITVASIVERGLVPVLADMERKHGGRYETRKEELKPGRPTAKEAKNGETVKR